ncbi:glycosyltransferase BC10 [Euphorbia lathyris]|uniref:glycosyltransferase BC10 n=1 Tax=Euphorbia lathyris TaxID=212925 RepID=UPI003313B63F
MAMEEGKEPGFRLNQSRPLPLKLLQVFLLFLVFGLGISITSMYMFRFFGIQNVVPAAISKSNMIYPCFEEPNDIENWIKPPSNLMHRMNDTELLWRASFVPRLKKYPFARTPKIAFMFLTKGPLPLAPLWERFFKGHEGLYSIYLHSFPPYVGNFTASSVFYKRQIPSQLVEWGRMSMCDGERRLLANALLDISNEWFILLSEACIPLQNFSIIYRYISRSRQSFMGSFDEPGPFGRGRYNFQMQPEVTLEQWRKGSQWFEVNRRLAYMIIADTTYYPKFKKFCTPACYVDEHYFQTMLSIRVPHLLANRTLTWTDWSRGGAHPATFGKADITEAFFKKMFEGQPCDYNNQPTTVCFLFARKFAPSALDPLLQLSSKVFHF